MKDFTQVFATIVGAIIGLAILSVIISKGAQTPQVIQAIASALGNVISAATKPVTSGSSSGSVGSGFSSPGFEDFLYNTSAGQGMAQDVVSSLNMLKGPQS